MAELLIFGLSLIGIGFLYLYVVQPILVDFKLIPPRGGTPVVVEITSSAAVSRLSDAVVSTDQTAQTPDGATQTANEDDIRAARRVMLLGVYRSMRAVPGMTREQARAILQSANLPLDNNLWVEAKPAAKEGEAGPIAYTPIAGRPYDPREYFQDDPQLQYQPPAA